MAAIEVRPQGGDVYRVTVSEGSSRSEHDVSADPGDVERYGGGAGPEALLRASFEFLLEREPKESILRSFRLPVIERYFPEYPAEIRKRLA